VALDKAEHLIFTLAQKRNMQALTHIKHIVETSFQSIEARYENRDALSGVPSGFYDLDAMTSGFQPNDLVIIAARPSMGKTAFVLNLAQAAAVDGNVPVAIFSLEMSKESLVQRMLCAEAKIDANRLRTGHLHTNDWTHLAMAMGRLGEAPIYIDDSAMMNVLEIRAKCRRLKSEAKGLGMVIIDYIQLLQGRKGGTDNRVQEVSEISRGLKTLARELGTPVIALSQLSRAVEARQNKRPMLSDLRESGCLTGDSMVFLPDSGGYARIDSLVGKTDTTVLALNTQSWQLEPKKVLNAFCTGTKQTFKMTTALNRQIKATGNHKFLTIDGWKRLDELQTGERLAVPRHLPSGNQGTMSTDELGLLGYLIGDGCTLARHALQYTTKDEDLANNALALSSKLFGDRLRPSVKKERSWFQVYLSSAESLTHGKRNPISEWLDSLGVFDLRSWEKFIPEKVFEQPRSHIAVFLKHLWSTDGTVWIGGKDGKANRIFYATSSERLAHGVQSLLLKFGINARILRVSQGTKGRDQFHVNVSGAAEQLTFLTEIGLSDERRAPICENLREQLQSITPNTNRDLLPKQVWGALVEPARVAIGMTTRQMHAAIDSAYCGSSLYKASMSRERADKVAQAVQSPELKNLANSGVYWDEIISIEAAEIADVFDLTVEDHHNFVANNVVVHNSIEQDADLVMFIYRDEYYNPESEKRGEAEIIIAKQRNGPVGTVDLLYQGSITRFLNKVQNQYPPA
ncbi:MAG: replicative DNA helicase, partial [Cyanobacteria bacterium SZAS LIN-2]|nr:replicative DNA helicase [Cyanobacteria bacterium SZAS LIN-2]